MSKKRKDSKPKLRMVVEFDVEPAEGQSVDEALEYLASSIGDTLSDATGCLYSTYTPDGKPSEDSDGSYKGPYLTGIKVGRQDAVNKPNLPIVEYTDWLVSEPVE